MYFSEYQIILYYRRTRESWRTDNTLWIISMHRKGNVHIAFYFKPPNGISSTIISFTFHVIHFILNMNKHTEL